MLPLSAGCSETFLPVSCSRAVQGAVLSQPVILLEQHVRNKRKLEQFSYHPVSSSSLRKGDEEEENTYEKNSCQATQKQRDTKVIQPVGLESSENTRVKFLKVIKPRLSSCEGLSVPARILGWSGNEVKDSLPDLLLNEQLKNNIPKNISGWENFGFLQLFRKISYSVASCENLFLPSNLYKTC